MAEELTHASGPLGATVAEPTATPLSLRGYVLQDEIGRGGMGVVYRARDTALDRDVAVKLLSESYPPDSVPAERFVSEARITAQLQHPGIPAVHQVGTLADGRPFLAMKLIKGSTLETILKYRLDLSAGRGPAAGGLAIFEAVCQAVGYAHAHRVIHRDLKPANVMVGAFGEVQVMDWGLAKVLGQESPGTADALSAEETRAWTQVSPAPASGSHTQVGSLVGTPAFIPPEQALGEIEKVDERSDVFGLGAILAVILTGKPPYVGESFESVRVQSVRGKLEDCFARLDASGAEPELVALCKKCLAFEPANRPADAGAVAAAVAELRAAADERARQAELERVQAEGETRAALARAAEQRRRRRILLRAGAIIALVFLVGFAGVLWQWRVATQASSAAIAAEAGADIRRQEAELEKERADQSQRQSRRLLYAADMNLAQQALKLNNLGRARRLLDRHRPQLGEEDLRGWEWRYLWQLTRSSALATLTHRPVSGFNVSFSPDGSRLAVGWSDGHVDLWDVPGRRLIRALANRERPSWTRVAFSPLRNLLAATSDPKVVTLYDLDSGGESVLWRAPQEGSWNVRDLSFSRDGSRLVIYAASTGKVGEVWVVNVSSATVESRHSTHFSGMGHFGAARLAPDNRRLYLARSDQGNERYSIQCLDLATNQEVWQTETQRDAGVATLAISPEGEVLVSGSGFGDPTIHVWDAATGRLVRQLDGHSAWVSKLVFSKDGRQLASSAVDQTIRLWDTSTWTETRVLRGHSDEVYAVAISPTEPLVASVSKDGDLTLWKADGKSAADDYRRMQEDLSTAEVGPQDQSRVVLLPKGKPPHLVDLKQDVPSILLTELGSSDNVLGCFGTNILCQWDGANRIIVRELHGTKFTQRGVIEVESGQRPSRVAYSVARRSLAWNEGPPSNSVFIASLAAPSRRMELKSDIPGLVPDGFSEDGKYLVAVTTTRDNLDVIRARGALRAWDVETGQVVASINEMVSETAFGAEGRVLVVGMVKGADHEIVFFDLAHPDQAPRRCGGKLVLFSLAVSPDGGLVAAATAGGLVRLFDPAKGELIESLHGHLNAVFGLNFSPDGRRLTSEGGQRETIKLWDVGTRQELLTLAGAGSVLRVAQWAADGDVILAGPPWQVWRAPSWEEIAAAEAKETKEAQRP